MLPVLIDLGFFQLPTYGVLLVSGIALALFLAYRRAKGAGLDAEHIVDLGMWVVLWGLAGAKILLVVTDTSYLSSPQAFIGLLRAGGVFYGGLIGALAATVVLLRRYQLAFFPVADVLAPSVAFGHFFGRLGCFSAGCCYGAECHEPWAVIFHHPLAHSISGTPLGVPLHPTQLYEAAFNLANYAFLAWVYRKHTRPGTVIATYLISYGIGRFVIEFFRGDPDRAFILGGALSTSQGIALVMVPLGVAILIWMRARTGAGRRAPGSGIR